MNSSVKFKSVYSKRFFLGVEAVLFCICAAYFTYPLSAAAAASLSMCSQTEIFDGVERVQVDGGWVSMRLREDRGAGAPLIMPLN